MSNAKVKVKLTANINNGKERNKAGDVISVTKAEQDELAKAGVIDADFKG